MTVRDEHELLTRYYDGEIAYDDLPPDLRRDADRFGRAMAALAAERIVAPPTLKPAVMARIRQRRAPVGPLVASLALAAGALLAVLGWPSGEVPEAPVVRVAPIVAQAVPESAPAPTAPSAARRVPRRQTVASRLDRSLDRETLAAVRPIIEAAGAESLPVVALELRALEGVAKGRPPEQIATAIDQLAGQLQTARALLREADSVGEPTEEVIVAAAYALDLGVPSHGVTSLANDLAHEADLEVPLVLLGDLVARGIPAADAGGIVVHLVQADVPPARLAQIAPRLDLTLRAERQPREALSRTLRTLGLPDLPRRPDFRR